MYIHFLHVLRKKIKEFYINSDLKQYEYVLSMPILHMILHIHVQQIEC